MIILFEDFKREGETPEQLWSRLVNLIISGRAGGVSGIGGETYVFSQMKRLLKTNPQLIDGVWDWDKPTESALFRACKDKLDIFVKFLIENGADVNKGDQFNRTPLHEAAIAKNVYICKMLIDAGANPNIQTKGGLTPAIATFHNLNDRNTNKALETFDIIYKSGGDPFLTDANNSNVWTFVELYSKSDYTFLVHFQREFPDIIEKIKRRNREQSFDL